MTVKDPGRIPVGLFEGASISDDAVLRLSTGASRIVAFAEGADASAITGQWSGVAPAVEVEVVPAVSDIREAIIECAKRKVIWVAAPTPRNAGRFVAGALQGAAAATEFEIPSVAVHVLREESVEGSVAWLTQTGEMSGYGVLYAAAVAAMGGRSVTLISPTAVRATRTPEALEAAERYIEESGIEVLRLSDPSPLQRVLGGEFGAVVHPVLDAPGGRSLLHPGELPAKSVAEGNAAAVVELIEKATGDVIAVFDGVQLVYGGATAAKIAASVALGVVALTGVGAAVAPAAMAAGVTATSQQAAPAAVSVTTVGGHEGMGHSASFHVVNRLDHDVTLTLTAVWVHNGNHPDIPEALLSRVIPAGQSVDIPIPRPSGVGQGGYHLGNGVLSVPEAGIHVTSAWPSEGVPPAFPQQVQGRPANPQELSPNFVVTGKPAETATSHGRVPDPAVGNAAEAHSSVPTPPPTVPPMQVPTPTPTATPTPTHEAPMLVPPKKTPGLTPGQVPPKTPPVTQAEPHLVPPRQTPTPTPVQVPGQVPTATPQAIPQMVPGLVAQTPDTGTQTPGTTGGPGEVPGGQVTTATTGTSTSTPGTTVVGTRTGSSTSGTTHAGTHEGGTTTHAATHETGGSTEAQATGGPNQLAHTGAGETGMIAAIAAALMAAGAGIAAAARRGAEDDEEASGGATS
jgi:hypothetical protein